MAQPTDPRPVHPVADLFPMLPAHDLAELGEDIRRRGLLHRIVLDGDGRVLDGRNRLAACELTGVEPEFTTYDGDDPAGYALAVNIARRHMTKGQLAMVAAQAASVSKGSKAEAAKAVGVSASRVSQAVAVLTYADELVDSVIYGARGLDEAYGIATKRKEELEGEAAQLDRLRTEFPDLAEQVAEEALTLKGAQAEARARFDDRRVKVRQAESAAGRILADTQTAVTTITIGAPYSESPLIDADTVKALRVAVDLLEEVL